MTGFVLRRLAAVVPVMFLVSLMTFSLLYLVPGDPAIALAGEGASADQIARVRSQLGLDDPLIEQYLRWLGSVLRGDLGDSLFSAHSVSQALGARLPVTLSIVGFALVLALLMGIPAGIISAVYRGRWPDRAANLVAATGVSIPNYFIGLLLIMLFVLKLGWLPATGYVGISEDVGAWFKHAILPALALATGTAAIVTRQLRSSMIGVLEQDYIRSARAKGLPMTSVVLKHGLKNAAIPVMTVIGIQIGLLVGATAIVERIFGIPGLGSLAIDAVLRRDLPVIQGIVLVTAVVVQLANLATDFAYGFLNPKVRVS